MVGRCSIPLAQRCGRIYPWSLRGRSSLLSQPRLPPPQHIPCLAINDSCRLVDASGGWGRRPQTPICFLRKRAERWMSDDMALMGAGACGPSRRRRYRQVVNRKNWYHTNATASTCPLEALKRRSVEALIAPSCDNWRIRTAIREIQQQVSGWLHLQGLLRAGFSGGLRRLCRFFFRSPRDLFRARGRKS